jgi:hypothetical protein
MLFKVIESLSLIYWDEEIVVYHQNSGDTYLFGGINQLMFLNCLTLKVFSAKDLFNNMNEFFEAQLSTDIVDTFIDSITVMDLVIRL